MRVYPKHRRVTVEHILCQPLSSLIYNLADLVPERFDKLPDLGKRNFELLAPGGALGIDAGLRILETLPPLDLDERKMLCVMDGLSRAENRDIAGDGRRLIGVLGRFLARNNGRLLCTVAKKNSRTT